MAKLPGVVWHWAQPALVGMWFAGLVPLTTSLANVGVVTWQPPQSPAVGCCESSALEGRESPAVVPVLAIMPRYGALSWQVWHAATALATVLWPGTVSVGLLILALPMRKPPGFTF